MKLHFAFLLPFLSCAVLAQTGTAIPKPYSGCGPTTEIHKVTNSEDVSNAQPQAGMAQVVFIEDEFRQRPDHAPCVHCTTRVRLGMDGQWVAVNSGYSHSAISITPGEHHFCADTDSASGENPQPSMFGMLVEANKIYFLRARLTYNYGYNISVLDLDAINEDEGRFMVSTTKLSSFTLK